MNHMIGIAAVVIAAVMLAPLIALALKTFAVVALTLQVAP